MPIKAAAEYLGVSRATVERLVSRGQLPVVKVGAATRYDVEDLDEIIAVEPGPRSPPLGLRGVTLRDLIEREGEGA